METDTEELSLEEKVNLLLKKIELMQHQVSWICEQIHEAKQAFDALRSNPMARMMMKNKVG